ncbi:MAG: STAS domain-containing protein [Desulfuromonadaceae bacterium]|nr:STAS domain-containing protein [Desulfuromonadaceae bacterium]
MTSRLVPELWCCLKQGYRRSQLLNDVVAGVIVGIVALPLAIAFAIASGVKPEQGLFTAVVAGFLISVFSGSRVQIGGPTGAFIVVVYAIVEQHGYGGLAVATLMAGALLLVMGFARLGAAIRFIPYPMTVGFTAGIALIIAVTQGRDLLGLTLVRPASGFVTRLQVYAESLGSWNPMALLVAAIALLILVLWPRLTHKIPGSIVALLVTTALVHGLDWPVTTIGSEFGGVPSVLPRPSLPEMHWEMVPDLLPAAFTIAMLGAIESLLSAVVADGMTGMRHKSNMELVAQGLANLVSPLFGGIPATGAIARTATNIKNGGRTPVAGMVHALTLLLIMLAFGRWAAWIPMPTLAAILLVVSYHMSEWRHFVRLLRSPKHDILVLLSTFFLTVFVDLTVAIETGVVLSALLFMQRMANATEIRHISREVDEDFDEEDVLSIQTRDIPEGVEVFEVHGPFFFGAANRFKDAMSVIEEPPQVLILRMRHISSLDATALRVMEDLLEKSTGEHTRLILSGVTASLLRSLEGSSFYHHLGANHAYPDIDAALVAARRHLGLAE